MCGGSVFEFFGYCIYKFQTNNSPWSVVRCARPGRHGRRAHVPGPAGRPAPRHALEACHGVVEAGELHRLGQLVLVQEEVHRTGPEVGELSKQIGRRTRATCTVGVGRLFRRRCEQVLGRRTGEPWCKRRQRVTRRRSSRVPPVQTTRSRRHAHPTTTSTRHPPPSAKTRAAPLQVTHTTTTHHHRTRLTPHTPHKHGKRHHAHTHTAVPREQTGRGPGNSPVRA